MYRCPECGYFQSFIATERILQATEIHCPSKYGYTVGVITIDQHEWDLIECGWCHAYFYESEAEEAFEDKEYMWYDEHAILFYRLKNDDELP